MPRRLIKRFIPSDETLKNHKSLGYFGKLILAPNLWHLNKRSCSGASVVGLFCAFIPIPFQMGLAAAGAIAFRVNLPISVALVWLTNPITMPPVFYASYMIGSWVLNTPPINTDIEFSYEWLESQLSIIWQPFLVGSLICGAVAALLGYISTRLLWRFLVIKNWNKRRQNRT